MFINDRGARAEALTLAAVFTGGFAISGLAILKPLIVGGLIKDYGFTPQQAGLIAGIEMVGIALASFVLATLGSLWNRRRVVIVGATLGILGSIGPASSDQFTAIAISRFVAGAGCGVVGSVMLSMVGAARDPDRAFGLYYATIYTGASVLVVCGAWVIAEYHVAGGYVLLALLLASIYLVVRRVPANLQSAARTPAKETLPPFPFAAALMSLLGYFLFCVGLGGTWAFIERIGDHNGLGAATIGWVLAVGPYASIAGALTAAVVRTRFGRMTPTMVSVALAMASAMFLSIATTGALFAAGVLMFSFAWSLFFACLGALLAAQDAAGRVIAMSITSQTLGMAVGPAAAGFLVSSFGYGAVAVFSVSCYCAGLFLLLPGLTKRPQVIVEPYGRTTHAPAVADP